MGDDMNDMGDDMNDMGDDMGGTAAALSGVEERLRDIEGALERLDASTYGSCASCGRAISDTQLATEPTSSLCDACLQSSGRSIRSSGSDEPSGADGDAAVAGGM
jgi:RNA polymerase-binding transcription factor DksA